jgi:hypothetical protein
MQKPFGAGAVGALVVERTVFCEAFVTAAVETADTNMKIPARAIAFSMLFSYVLVGSA